MTNLDKVKKFKEEFDLMGAAEKECKICNSKMHIRSFRKHLLNSHNLSLKEYVLKISNADSEPVCLNCGNPCRFLEEKFRLFSSFCSFSCSQSYYMKIKNNDEDFKEKSSAARSQSIKTLWETNEEFRNKTLENFKKYRESEENRNNLRERFKRDGVFLEAKRLIKSGGTLKRYFYLVSFNDEFIKVGSFNEGNERRLERVKSEYKNSKVILLLKSSQEFSAYLEAEILSKFPLDEVNCSKIIRGGWSEVRKYSDLSSVLSYISTKISNSSETIEIIQKEY